MTPGRESRRESRGRCLRHSECRRSHCRRDPLTPCGHRTMSSLLTVAFKAASLWASLLFQHHLLLLAPLMESSPQTICQAHQTLSSLRPECCAPANSFAFNSFPSPFSLDETAQIFSLLGRPPLPLRGEFNPDRPSPSTRLAYMAICFSHPST